MRSTGDLPIILCLTINLAEIEFVDSLIRILLNKSGVKMKGENKNL